MNWTITPEGLFSAGGLMFITVGLVCSFVRWAHMCKPFNSDAGYYYPARNQVTFFYASAVLTFPYVIAPMEPAVWIYTRCFNILFYPVCFAVLISRYFRLKADHGRHALRTLCLVAPYLPILALLVMILAGCDEWLTGNERKMLLIAGGLGIIYTITAASVLMSLRKEMERYNTENYSNDEDFPYKFASKIVFAPMFWIILMWIVFLCGNRWIKLTIDLVFSGWLVYFLTIILHPQRVLRPQDIGKEIKRLEEIRQHTANEINTESSVEEESPTNDSAPSDMIREEVLAVILHRFREPHLLKTEVLMDLGNGKMNAASKFISQIGYYNLVNMFRLEYARLYKEAHPNAKQEEIAQESGFASRTAYYKAKKNVGGIDPDLTKMVKLTPPKGTD